MAEELKIKDVKSIACHGFVEFLQEIIAAANEGWTLDVRSKYCPQFMVGIFCANFYKLEEEEISVSTNEIGIAEDAVVEKPKKTYAKSAKAKAALAAKLPADALQTITE